MCQLDLYLVTTAYELTQHLVTPHALQMEPLLILKATRAMRIEIFLCKMGSPGKVMIYPLRHVSKKKYGASVCILCLYSVLFCTNCTEKNIYRYFSLLYVLLTHISVLKTLKSEISPLYLYMKIIIITNFKNCD